METVRFDQLDLYPQVLRAIAEMGFEEATPIQSQAIPVVMSGVDVIGQAQTGTGKTASFGIPVLHKVDPNNKKTQVIILSPTRELAIQVADEIRKLAKYMHGVKILPVYGGQEISRQIKALKGGAQIIIGTPGRVMDHLRRKTIRCEAVNTIVLDEADEMLNMGFREDIETILEYIPEEGRQTVLFSATMPKPILDITKKYQHDAVTIKVVKKELTVPNIEQYYYDVKRKDKIEVLTRLLDYYNPKLSLVFCNTKRMVDELTEELQKTANDIHYGNAHAGIHVTIHRLTSVSDYLKNEYQTVAPPLLRASKKLQSTILPLLKEEQQGGKQKNLLFGKRLDSHALYKTDGTIFTRTRLPGEEKRLAVALLIDESGSMGWGDRMTHARKTAIVLYDFCKSLGIPITIYGHSTDAGGVALYSYAEFDSVDNEDCYRLMDMCDRNGNRDGAALRFVAEHLCTRPELQKLLILISDGQPADYGYSGTEAEADLRGIKKEYEKRDVILFAAAIGDDKENIRRIYKDGFLDITKLEELPKNMAQLVKQHLK